MGTRAGIYGRQSKDKTKSIDEQIGECASDVRAQGWTVAETYTDGASASRFATKGRPDWDRLLSDLSADRLDVLVLWESSRGDRNLTTWSALLDTCREHEVLIRVSSHGRTYDMNNERDWKSLAEDGVDSAYESGKTSTRLKRAVAAGAAKGKPHGRVIYGYERIYDPVTRALVEQRPHPAQAPIVREIVTRIARGEAVGAVVKDLNCRGIPSPGGGRWERNTLRAIALNVAYTGKRVLRNEVYPAIWPALVDDGAYLAAKRILTDPARRTRHPGAQRWLLSYLATCACGATLVGKPAKERATRSLRERYECRLRGSGCTCIVAGSLDGEHIDGLDSYVMEIIVKRLAREDGPDLRPTDDATVLAARADASAIQERLDEWRDSAARGETSPASLARIEAQLTGELAAAHRRAERASRPAALGELLDGAEGREDVIRTRILAQPVTVQREIIRELMDIRVHRAAVPGRHVFDAERIEIAWRS